MFGINLKYGFPFLAAMIGSMIAGVVSVASGVMANSIGVGGLPGILSIQAKHMAMFAICMVIAIVVPFILTTIFSKTRLNKSKLSN
jgi:PTS system trehalose-specific IIC component